MKTEAYQKSARKPLCWALTAILWPGIGAPALGEFDSGSEADAAVTRLRAQIAKGASENESRRHDEPVAHGLVSRGDCFAEDADDDGMADTWELDHGLDPADPDDAWFDPDDDEVLNLFEFQLAGDPHNATTPPIATLGPSGADFTSVGEAIDGVDPGTVIRVAGGTYEVYYFGLSELVVMIQGGWSKDFTQRDLREFPTTLDGHNGPEILNFLMFVGHPVIVLDGIHFVGGTAGAANLTVTGSACARTSVVNCSFIENSGLSFAGALSMHNWNSRQSDRTIANTIIANTSGSGIYSQVKATARAHWRLEAILKPFVELCV